MSQLTFMTQKRSRLTNKIIHDATPNVSEEGTLYTRLIGDSNGLYFQISGGGVRSWNFRYTLGKKTRSMGLGPLRNLTLEAARKRARELKVMADQKIDPPAARDLAIAQREKEVAEASNRLTFRQCAESYLAHMKAAHKNAKHHAQWHSTLEKYAFNVIGDMPVQDFTVKEGTKIIDPLWSRTPETGLLDALRKELERRLVNSQK